MTPSRHPYSALAISIQLLHSWKLFYGLFAILWASGAFLVPSLCAQEASLTLAPAIEYHGEGHINWTSGILSAKGFGAAPPTAPPASAQTMATRAALAVARRNLLELVEGVRIDSETLVENFMVKSDIIQSHVQGLVKNAFITKKNILADGNVEIVMSMNMWGNDSLISNLIAETAKFSNTWEGASHTETYTGLIIDARELGVQPATFPTVTDEKGQILYGKKTAPRDLIKKMGMVEYFVPVIQSSATSPKHFLYPVADQKPHPAAEERVGPRPLHIKGIQKSGSWGTDIMVSAADAEKIRQDSTLMNLLHNANVIIVIDPLVAGVEGSLRPGNVLPVNYP